MLAIAWDRKVQVAKLVKSELKVYGKWSIDSAAIGVAWLDDQVCMFCLLNDIYSLLASNSFVFLFWLSVGFNCFLF